MTDELLDIVDESGQVIATKSKSEVQDGDRLRYVQVYLFDEDGKFIVQQRQEGRIRANLLDASVAGHVASGESYKAAALREMQEELAVQVDIDFLDEFSGPWGVCHLFIGKVNWSLLKPNGEEVKNLLRYNNIELFSLVRDKKWMFSEGFLSGLNIYNQHYFKPLTHVNHEDEVLGAISYDEMNKKRAPVRVVHVYVRNKKGEYLFQRRGVFVEAPYALDEAATGHVDYGESYEQAASRELFEEMGVQHSFTIEDEIYHGQLKHNNKFVKCYLLEYDGVIKIDESEVENVTWLSFDEVDNLMQKAPFLFTKSSIELHEKCYDKLR